MFIVTTTCTITEITTGIIHRIAGYFHEVYNFAFFEGREVNAEIKTGINSHAPVF